MRDGRDSWCRACKNEYQKQYHPAGNARRREARRHAPERFVWRDMIRRCTRPRRSDFHHYGGRGIRVCDRWLASFDAFLADMGPRPSPKHSIDRIDNNGDYEPGNCRWATQTQQLRNFGRTRLITALGETLPLVEWAERLGVPSRLIHQRLDMLGWPPDEAVSLPPRARRSA